MSESTETQGRKYRLETASGYLVRTSTQMPPFVAPPEVVVWGTRFFTLVSPTDAEELVYREAFTWFAAAEIFHEDAPPTPVADRSEKFVRESRELGRAMAGVSDADLSLRMR